MKTRAHKVVAKNKERRAHREQASGADVGVSVSVVRTVSLAPLAHAVALIIATGAWHSAHAQQAFSSAWFAAKGAAQSTAASTGYLPNGMPASSLTNPALQQQKANQQLQTSLNNLSLVARGIAAQQAAQQAARLAAMNGGGVPDGLADGGLKIDTDSLTKGWLNANAPTQTTADGKTVVSIQQTADRAILNWETFNVGKNTILSFLQQPSWAVLNRVNDPLARPSQIQGQIKGDGTVMIVNRNGIVFSGSSQVDTRNLVAAAASISDAQFRTSGIYSAQASGNYVPAFTDANGALIVEAGAQIRTATPTTSTQGGGYALLLGKDVRNAGSVMTPGGQVQLAAGDFFIVRPGQSTTVNQYSTTRGNEFAPQFNAGSSAGNVTNTGLLAATEGDVTLAGRTVVQDGVALATTSVNGRGTIHLLTSASDAQSAVTVTAGSITTILLNDNGDTALDSQRAALITQSAQQDVARRAANSGVFDNLSKQDDRQDQSRVEIVSGGNVSFAGGSSTLATGGQIAVSASSNGGRTTVASGAMLDVSGSVGVNVSMASNNVQINVQGNEQRDSPLNRDTANLNSSNVWIDRRNLIYVPAGTGGYASDRWYTPGGLLEVSGYLGLTPHGIGEWAAQGGSVAFSGAEVVTQRGSNINLSGGTLNVQTGYIQQSWLKGADGQLYELSRAPGDVAYTGLYRGFEDTHARWGAKATEFFYNPLIGPQQRLENGYTVGRDAGRLIIATSAAVLEGDVTADTYQGPQQTQKANTALDGYNQSQRAAAAGGQLILGSYASAPNVDPNVGPLGVFHNLQPTFADIVFKDDYTTVADSLQNGGVNVALPHDLQGNAYLDSKLLNGFGLGSIQAAASHSVTVEGALTVSPGGAIGLYAPEVGINADLMARGGSIVVGNVLSWTSGAGKTVNTALPPAVNQSAGISVAGGVTLDASGLWTNLLNDADNIQGLPYVNGGSVSLRSTGNTTLAQGSVIDVSSGAALMQSGALQGGRGGDVTLAAGYVVDGISDPASAKALLTLEGELRAYGVNGGGSLNVLSGVAVGIGGKLLATDGLLPAGQAAPANLRLLQDYQLAVGERAPMDISMTTSHRPAGYLVPAPSKQRILTFAEEVRTSAAWVLPNDPALQISDNQGNVYFAGSTVPAGTVIVQDFYIQPGFVIPPAVFPNGLPIAATKVYYAAGSILDVPVTLAAGSVLAVNAVLSRSVTVAPTGVLAPALFQTGFSRYVVAAGDGITVLPGTSVPVNMPVLRTDAVSLSSLPTGTRLAARLPAWTPPLYQEDALRARLTQRGGASLELDAGVRASADSSFAALTIGTDAHVSVDPGQNISLWSNGGQLTIDGRLDAWGGNISIQSTPSLAGKYVASTVRSVWIGDNAVLDVAGRAYTATDTQGRVYGIAPNGGSIDVGLSDSFIVIRPGATLDASGAYAEVDGGAGGVIAGAARPLALAGAGGSIGLHSYVGMVLDGSMLARAGGTGTAGGSLTLEMANRVYLQGQEAIISDAQVLHNITLTQQQRPGNLAADLAPGQADAGLKYGAATLGVDKVQAGGFDALTLSTHDLFVFDGNIDLALGRSLNLRNGFLTVASGTPDAAVHLSAPYIRLDGGTWAGQPSYYSPGIVDVRRGLQVHGNSALSLAANLIDVYGLVQSGINGTAGDGAIEPPYGGYSPPSARAVTADGFASILLQSEGDLRLNNAAVVASGDLRIDAAQIYPGSGQHGALVAGAITNAGGQAQWDTSRSLIIRSNGQAAPMPDSVFGRLVVMAPLVDQGGILRAPLGTISLNDTGGSLYPSAWLDIFRVQQASSDMRLILRAGSLTSVSANGLTMPYGGTSDGLSYRGADGTLFSLGANAVNRSNNGDATQQDSSALPQGISLGGGSVVTETGSVLDLSGGGDLRGAGFISGRGGSVNILTTPLVNANPATYRQSSNAGNAVYAIMPGYASDYAPLISDKGAGDPAIGRQITIGAGVPGLPAGVYTLLPASFALMPGAWRVEVGAHINALAGSVTPSGPVATSSGSWNTLGTLSIAGTAVRDSLPSQVLVTPGETVRHFSQYNETGYADFAVAQAKQFGSMRPMLPMDGKVLRFNFTQNDNLLPLQLDGTTLLDPAAGGVRGQVSVLGNKPINIVGGPAQATVGAITLSADTLSSLRASTLTIGGLYSYSDGQDLGSAGAHIGFYNDLNSLSSAVVNVRAGATLRAGQIFLVGGQIVVDGDAVLDTRGMGRPGVDSNNGFLYGSNAPAVLAVSNGWLDMLPSVGTGQITTRDGATLLTEGTIAFSAPGGLSLGDVKLGARYLTVAQDQINIGTTASLAAAQAAGTVQPGWQVTQSTLDRLLHPSGIAGVPALERLSLTAGGAFNFYGALTLDTGDSSAQMVFNTPAFYGLGGSSDVVRIATRDFVWNGIATGNGTAANPYVDKQPVVIQPGGPGTGSGSLVIDATRVQFGYDALSQPQRQTELGRVVLGFGNVTILASERVTANNRGSLSVGLSQDVSGVLQGGALSIVTPLLTGQAGSAMRYAAGGTIAVSEPQGAAPANTAGVGELGASLTLQGASVSLDTAVALPSGVLKIMTDGDISLGNAAQVDLSGRAVSFFDVTKYSWGGDATFTSANGNIAQASGARIDVSALNNDAGSLTLSAVHGTVTLAGALAAFGGGAGFADGRFGLTVNRVADADFAALNQHLNQAAFFDARSFVVKNGDLTVGDGVRAHSVSITTDGGSLTVDGMIDASANGAGSITLAAKNDLVLTGRAVLDAHGKTLVTDSYGAAVDASNRAKVTLSAIDGTVRLNTGATADLSSADGVARGRIDINAPRVGGTVPSATGAGAPANATGDDVAIEAAGALTIRGAQSIALNGVARYSNAPVDPDNANTQIITQAWLDLIDQDSSAFDVAARGNAGLQGRIAGLTAYGSAFHLRPGVEIVSATTNGNLTVKGDLDLSGYRYGPNADRNTASAFYGAGEPMALVMRAGGDLTINGSINDGFAPPPATPDDSGWQIHQSVLVTGQAAQGGTFSIPYYADWGDYYYVFPSALTGVGYPVVVSGSITDGDGTVYRAGDTLSNGFLYGTIIIAPGTILRSDVAGGADITFAGQRAAPGRMWAISPMLAAGSLSASIRLVSGADLAAADTRRLQTAAQLVGKGDMVLDDLHLAGTQTATKAEAPSVIRTGTGDLDLYVGGNYEQKSLYGVYTAGTAIAAQDSAGYNAARPTISDGSVLGAGNSVYEATLSAQRMWFAGGGGDFTLSAQGDITGYLRPGTLSTGDWLWRQGGAEIGQYTAWGINFGSYVNDGGSVLATLGFASFAGVGTLGGGNATIRSGGNIGVVDNQWSGLLAAVGGSGRVTDQGQLLQTGGGTLEVSAGGRIGGGLYANLRGDTNVAARDVGTLTLTGFATPNAGDPRAADPHTAYSSRRSNAVNFAPGDGVLNINTLGDIVLGNVADPGRVSERVETQASTGIVTGPAATWFTLWTDRTTLNLFSAGGNVSPFGISNIDPTTQLFDVGSSTLIMPSIVSAVAAGGSIYFATSYAGAGLMMPSPQGHLDLLARGLISGDTNNNGSSGSNAVGPLGTSIASIATPKRPAWRIAEDTADATIVASNYWGDVSNPLDYTAIYNNQYDSYNHVSQGTGGTMFMFGLNTVTDRSAAGSDVQSHIYALNGDIMSLELGQILRVGQGVGLPQLALYQGSKPVRIMAGGDIVNSHGLIVDDAVTDVSMLAAGRDILYANFSVAGPGVLEVSAGGKIYQGDHGSLASLGPLAVGDSRPGASIAVQAGLGSGLPGQGASDFAGFASLYFDPANRIDAAKALAVQPGKVVKTYEVELTAWLKQRFGYAATTAADALAYFTALAPEQQRVFVRQVYYAELTAGGREYNDSSSRRFGSYLRGREAIATLFPLQDSAGKVIQREGDLTLFQGSRTNSGIRTVAGGDLQILTPAGKTIVGVEGITPSADADATPAGLITQGNGAIQIYAQDSVLLGLSRVMTSFGGDILVWSANGDINAGRGSKTTLVYTPPKREYDTVGNVKVSPNVPSSGAGIATLAPLPEVPPGDVDLIAPLGTIDAGEAGIRVSGNVNLAALQVINAANIQVKGDAVGIPTIAAVNVGALTNASAAASSAATEAQDSVQRARNEARQALPSIFTVRVLGFGSDAAGDGAVPATAPNAVPAKAVRYDASSPVQLVGNGQNFDAKGWDRLTSEERRQLRGER